MTTTRCPLDDVPCKKGKIKMVIYGSATIPIPRANVVGDEYNFWFIFYALLMVCSVLKGFSLIALIRLTMWKKEVCLQVINGSSQYRENFFLKLCAALHTCPTLVLSWQHNCPAKACDVSSSCDYKWLRPCKGWRWYIISCREVCSIVRSVVLYFSLMLGTTYSVSR